MEIGKMREYVKLCETLNFTRAARELFLSQSTLSKHVSQIEEELGAQLIMRSTHEAALTAEGELARSEFSDLLAHYDSFVDELKSLRDGITGKLKVGFIYYGGMSYMREGLDRFFSCYPEVKVEFVSQQPHDTIAALVADELDAGLVPRSQTLDRLGFSFALVHECHMHAMVSASHPLAALDQLSPNDLDGAQMLMLAADADYNEAVRAAAASAGATLEDGPWCDQIDLAPLALAGNDAVFFVSSHVPVPPDGSLVSLPVGNPPILLEVGLYYRVGTGNGALEAFAGAMRGITVS